MLIQRNAVLAVFLAACTHEFVWQAFPWAMQGDVRSVTQWFLIVALCACLAILARDRFTSAVCLAVTIMSSTTAGCSFAWLLAPWPVEPGAEQCSAHWGIPMLLVSGLAAVTVIATGRNDG